MESHAEEIIKIIHQQKKRKQLQNNDINKGYAEIFYNTVIFERTELCHKKFSMLTPAFLTSLENDTELEYSTQNKPEFIYVNETMDINMTFSLVENEQLQTDIFKMQKQMQQNIKQMYPNIMLTEQDILNTKDDVSIAYFCFPLKIEEETLMEVVFLFLVENQWVVGTFHCPDTQKRDWKDIVKQMLLSIQLKVC